MFATNRTVLGGRGEWRREANPLGHSPLHDRVVFIWNDYNRWVLCLNPTYTDE